MADETRGSIPSRSGLLSRWWAWLALVVVCVGLAVSAWLAADRHARVALSDAKEAWASRGHDLDALADRNPDHGPNESALRLEALCAAVTIDVVPLGSTRPYINQPVDPRVKSARAHLMAHATADDDELGRPPEELAAFFAEHRESWSAIKQLLLEAEPPSWEEERHARGAEGSSPYVAGLLRLNTFLVADALCLAEAGSHDQAEEALEASWRLLDGLRGRADLGAQFLVAVAVRDQAVAGRLLPHLSDRWLPRFREQDVEAGLVKGLRASGWAIHSVADLPPSMIELPDSARGMLGPALRDELRRESLATLDLLERIVERGGCGSPDLDEGRGEAGGNILLEKFGEGFLRDKTAHSWNVHRIIRITSYHLELASRVLEARRTFGRSAPVVPRPFDVQDSRCSERRWLIAPTSTGFLVHAEGPRAAPPDRRWEPPRFFRVTLPETAQPDRPSRTSTRDQPDLPEFDWTPIEPPCSGDLSDLATLRPHHLRTLNVSAADGQVVGTLISLIDGRRHVVRPGDELCGDATIQSVDVEQQEVVARLRLDDPRLLRPWVDRPLRRFPASRRAEESPGPLLIAWLEALDDGHRVGGLSVPGARITWALDGSGVQEVQADESGAFSTGLLDGGRWAVTVMATSPRGLATSWRAPLPADP